MRPLLACIGLAVAAAVPHHQQHSAKARFAVHGARPEQVKNRPSLIDYNPVAKQPNGRRDIPG
jgi:hypothetical protein